MTTTRECTVKLRAQDAHLVVTQTRYRFELKFVGRDQTEFGFIKEEPYGAAWFVRTPYLRKTLRGKATNLERAFECMCRAGLVVPLASVTDSVLALVGRTYNLQKSFDPYVRAFYEKLPTAKSRRDLIKALRDQGLSHLDVSDPKKPAGVLHTLPDCPHCY